jgi:hypothetical protein
MRTILFDLRRAHAPPVVVLEQALRPAMPEAADHAVVVIRRSSFFQLRRIAWSATRFPEE